MGPEMNDYLTKQILVERTIVTFRSLSRRFNIHVNVAKNELAAFHASLRSTSEPAYATYLLKGTVAFKSLPDKRDGRVDGNDMEVDGDFEDDEGEEVTETRVTLVGERDLEDAKAAYEHIQSEHVYSLSPSTVVDAGVICGPGEEAHKADQAIKLEASVALGRITGTHVRTGKWTPPVASTSKTVLHTRPSADSSKEKNEPKSKDTANGKHPIVVKEEEKPAALSKPKATGKLDWSKAKSKGKTAEADTKIKVKEHSPVDSESKATKVPEKKVDVKSAAQKPAPVKGEKQDKSRRPSEEKSSTDTDSVRGKKRKAALHFDSDSEDGAVPPPRKSSAPPAKGKSKPEARLNGKRKAILSDDDDDDKPAVKPTWRRKAKSAISDIDWDEDGDDDASLRAMMDIDDDDVLKVSHKREEKAEASASEPDTEAELIPRVEDVQMSDTDSEPVKPKRKRKEKKVWPVGKNGLKKRRVVKSKMTTDERGYMVTQDYSEYESVDEEEPEPEPPKAKKPTARPKKATTTEERKSFRPSEPHAKPKTVEKPKRSGSSGGLKTGQGSLRDFFGKK